VAGRQHKDVGCLEQRTCIDPVPQETRGTTDAETGSLVLQLPAQRSVPNDHDRDVGHPGPEIWDGIDQIPLRLHLGQTAHRHDNWLVDAEPEPGPDGISTGTGLAPCHAVGHRNQPFAGNPDRFVGTADPV